MRLHRVRIPPGHHSWYSTPVGVPWVGAAPVVAEFHGLPEDFAASGTGNEVIQVSLDVVGDVPDLPPLAPLGPAVTSEYEVEFPLANGAGCDTPNTHLAALPGCHLQI